MAAVLFRPVPILAPNLRLHRLPLRHSLPLPLRRSPPLSARRLLLAAAAAEDPNQLDVDVENDNNAAETAESSQEEWKQALESFKEEALKLKDKSQGAYDVYSEKMMVMLMETAEKLKIQADKARQDLGVLSKEIGEEGKVYLESAARNSPDEVKDVVEVFASVDELKHVSAVRDYHVGIPYGGVLALGGFLSFMLTGSIPAIRFGIVLGGALLALSVSSLRLWKKGERSPLLLKGQAAIAAILFLREWRVFSRVHSFPTILMALISGVVFAFYVYRIMVDGSDKGPRAEKASEASD